MNNGDRLTCEIEKLDRGVLYVTMDYVDGTVSIAWSKVKRLESSQLFNVETQSGTTYTGRLTMEPGPGDEPRHIEIVNDNVLPGALVEQSKVVLAQQYGDSVWRRLRGSFSAGLMYNKGSNTTQYNLATDLSYRQERNTYELNYNSAFSNTSGVSETTRNQLDFNAQRLARWNNWYYAGIGSFLQSSAQGIAFQSIWGGGIGRYLKNSSTTRIKLTGGLAFQDTQYSNRPADNNLVGFVAGELDMFRFKKTELTVTTLLFPNLTNPGRLRANLNAEYKVEIISDLWWNISLYGNWDNRPPPGLVGADYGTSVGLTYSFH